MYIVGRALEELEIGDVRQVGALSVFPLVRPALGPLGYGLFDEVAQRGAAWVQDRQNWPRGPIARNRSREPMMLFGGEIVRKACPAAAFSRPVLVAPGATMRIGDPFLAAACDREAMAGKRRASNLARDIVASAPASGLLIMAGRRMKAIELFEAPEVAGANRALRVAFLLEIERERPPTPPCSPAEARAELDRLAQIRPAPSRTRGVGTSFALSEGELAGMGLIWAKRLVNLHLVRFKPPRSPLILAAEAGRGDRS